MWHYFDVARVVTIGMNSITIIYIRLVVMCSEEVHTVKLVDKLYESTNISCGLSSPSWFSIGDDFVVANPRAGRAVSRRRPCLPATLFRDSTSDWIDCQCKGILGYHRYQGISSTPSRWQSIAVIYLVVCFGLFFFQPHPRKCCTL